MAGDAYGSLGTAASDFGGAAADFFTASGDKAEAGDYGQAATIERQNVQYAAESGAIQRAQNARQIYQTIGGQRADIAGAGLAESGTALNLLRSSASQGGLSQGRIAVQTDINENAYAAQADAYTGEQEKAEAAAKAANGAGIGSAISGVIAIAGAVAMFA